MCGMIYLGLALLSSPEYFSKALPIMVRTYYGANNADAWSVFIFDPRGLVRLWLVSSILMAAYWLKLKKASPVYWGYFTLATGFVTVYVIQGLAFKYHAMPGAIFSFVLGLLILLERGNNMLLRMTFSVLLVMATLYNGANTFNPSHMYMAQTAKLESTMQRLPKSANVAVLLCDNMFAHISAHHSQVHIASSFLSHYQLCAAFVNHYPKILAELTRLMRQDLMQYKPTYLIRHKKDFIHIAKEQSLFQMVFDHPTSLALWQSYKPVTMTKDYAIYQRHGSH